MNAKIYGKNPITLENINIYDWLAESNDNILLLINKNDRELQSSKISSKIASNPDIIYCLSRAFLETPALKNIYLKCILENDQLLKNDTLKSKDEYFHLGYFINKALLINLKDLKGSIFKKHRIFKVELERKDEEFICKEALQLANIDMMKAAKFVAPKNLDKKEVERLKTLFKRRSKKDLLKTKKNIPIKKDVYFENILAKALTNYSFQWDAPINLFLRQGQSYFETSVFKTYYKRYGKTLEEAELAIKNKIEDLDRAFLEAAPRNENDKTIYYRGMQLPFRNILNKNDIEIVPNFLSVSSSFAIAVRFSGIPRGSKCCLYKITIDKGIPLIDMVSTTKYKHEKEILLPRNLVFKLKEVTYINYPSVNPKYKIPILELQASLRNKDQFKITNGCKKYVVGKIVPTIPSYIILNEVKKENKKEKEKEKVAKDERNVPLNVDNDVKDEVQTHQVPLVGKRCPKGYKINKETKMCVYFDKMLNKTKKEKQKPGPKPKNKTKKELKDTKGMPRCKNGTRRSKISGNCEPI